RPCSQFCRVLALICKRAANSAWVKPVFSRTSLISGNSSSVTRLAFISLRLMAPASLIEATRSSNKLLSVKLLLYSWTQDRCFFVCQIIFHRLWISHQENYLIIFCDPIIQHPDAAAFTFIALSTAYFTNSTTILD